MKKMKGLKNFWEKIKKLKKREGTTDEQTEIKRVEEKQREHAKTNCLLEKKEKQKEAAIISPVLWFGLFVVTILTGFILSGISFFIWPSWILQLLILFVIPIALNILVIRNGWNEVEQNEEWIILLFGKWFTTWEPGLHIKFPFFMFIKAKVPMYTQSLRLYMDGTERDGIKEAAINFKNTTSAVTAEIFFRIYGSHRATFEIDNLFKGIREKTDSGIRAYYGTMELDKAIETKSDTNADAIITQKDTDADKFKVWGVEIESIAVTDIAVPPEIREQRDKIIIAEKERDAAEIAIETAKKTAEAKRIQQAVEGEAIGQEIKKVMDITGLDSKAAAQYLLNKNYFEAIKNNKGVIIASKGAEAPIMGAELAAGMNLTNQSLGEDKTAEVKKDGTGKEKGKKA